MLAERSRIARRCDSLDQGFTAISLQLELCARLADGAPAAKGGLRQRLDLTKDLLEYARSEAKRSISDLRAEALEGGDLVAAVSKVAEQFSSGSDLRVGVSVEGRARALPGAVESNLLRICQEAVANAVRHGQAREVAIGLFFEREAVRPQRQGRRGGFDPSAAGSGARRALGLMGIRERVEARRTPAPRVRARARHGRYSSRSPSPSRRR